ncbi:6-phosphogluconolactonase [Microbacterium sp. ASV49]|uniref:6-phosphogluconolactonase n=1 Tax=Microbacterium candidum TaxID=3041922 RepID=A0ABT7MZQ1_9MICO|nr:6-phosphogluconolactonase [Microbacterium sp. ASV49]MDL9979906.1 6-phosphogluconolactonase [Microbacterium sp. ASV49]
MAEATTEKRVVVRADPATLADSVARRFVQRLTKRPDGTGPVHVSLTGGSMGGAVLAAVREDARAADVDWSTVHFWWSDERFVAAGSTDRNDVQARAALLDHLDIPPGNIHAMGASDGTLDLDAAAEAYAAELARFGTADTPWPSFDVCFLGVGPDGHIASLFPDRPEILVTDRVTLPVRNSPKPPPDRITLTRPVINSSRRVWLVMTGADKASALGLALAGASYPSVPAAGAKGTKRTVFFVDEAAAGKVPPELIDPDY